MGKNILKFRTLVLAGALTAAAAVPALAEDQQGDYIIFLPVKKGVEYEADDSHVSEEYSTDKYTVLLYKPGDIVSFQVNSDSGSPFAIEEAVSGDIFNDVSIAPNGIVSFAMPALDLCIDPEWEGDTGDQGVWAGDTSNKGEPGTFTVALGTGLHGSATMVDGSYINFNTDKPLATSSNVDIIFVKSDEYLSREPVTKVFKNGELMADDSGVIINHGISDDLYTVDFSNKLVFGEDAYVVEIGDDATLDAGNGETDTAQEGESKEDASDTADGTVNAYFPQETDAEPATEAPATEAATEPATEPATQPVTEAATEPATEPATQAATEPYVDPATQPATEPYVDPATQAATEPYVDPAAQPATEPYVDPATQVATEPYVDPATQPATEPYVDPATQPATEPYVDSATQVATEPYVDPATQAATEPYVDPATQPATEPYVDPATQPAADPYEDPYAAPATQDAVDSGSVQTATSDGEAPVDMAVSSTMSTFADAVKGSSSPVTITVTTKVPEVPLIVKMADGTVETAAGSFVAEKEVEEIEFIGSMAYAPQIKILKDGEELEEDDIILEKMYLENGHLYFKVTPWDEIEAGDYEIQIG